MKRAILTAASLLSDEDQNHNPTNPEYDRALVEMVGTLTGIDTSDGMAREAVRLMLKALA